MAGILDVKRRIMDALITIDISFATFSDEGLFYDSEDGKSARDISDLPILEVMSLPRDTIIPEVDDDGTFSLSLADGNKVVHGRKVISGALDTISVNEETGVRTIVKVESVLTGALNAYSSSMDVVRTAKKHFQQLSMLRTDDGILDSQFKVDSSTFNLTTRDIKIALSAVRPLMFDDSINHTINTKFLPPEVTTDENKVVPLGDFPKFTNDPYNNFDAFKEAELDGAISRHEVNFSTTGRSNNLLGQVFEVNDDAVSKLAIIDYGEFVDEVNNRYRVFYLGKPLRDLNGTPKFCKLFTLVFER